MAAAAGVAGMCLTQADGRPAHLTRVHQALTALGEDDRRRLGVIADRKHGPHRLTYRQTERTFGLAADALAEDEPGGLPSGPLQAACDALLEASIPEESKDASRSLAVDWTDLESFSRPPAARNQRLRRPEASWGHRKNNLLRSEDELYWGYYLSAEVMTPEENGPAVPELTRRLAPLLRPPHRRRSYGRRTGAERGLATAKDPASNTISRGLCRLMGLTPLMLVTAILLIVRNQRILHAGPPGRDAASAVPPPDYPPKTRKRRRKTLVGLAAGPP